MVIRYIGNYIIIYGEEEVLYDTKLDLKHQKLKETETKMWNICSKGGELK